MLTEQQLDDWIVSKTDTHIIFEMMKDNVDVMVSVNFYPPKLVEEFGGTEGEWLYATRDALVRLLKAERMFAVGINGWTSKQVDSTVKVTPQRLVEVERVKSGEVDYMSDLDFEYN